MHAVQVINIIADYFLRDAAGIKPGLRLVEDLGADSLEILEITLALNEQLGIELPEEQLGTVRTVDDLCRLVNEQL